MDADAKPTYQGLSRTRPGRGPECLYNKRSTVRILILSDSDWLSWASVRDTVMPRGDSLVLGDRMVWGVRSKGWSRDMGWGRKLGSVVSASWGGTVGFCSKCVRLYF